MDNPIEEGKYIAIQNDVESRLHVNDLVVQNQDFNNTSGVIILDNEAVKDKYFATQDNAVPSSLTC